ncbi:12971_t:CDS:2 [Funneliformis caledonium]|uniref:12971_t:CDS:1 n=1 Tax=Funneliformis caledonium TaxID=1117310 RepID=A0A9N9HA79_9GLOM|nr:12971_t:CDS:2 [Funneliformis caledonium]
MWVKMQNFRHLRASMQLPIRGKTPLPLEITSEDKSVFLIIPNSRMMNNKKVIHKKDSLIITNVSQEYLENDNNNINTLSFPNISLGDGNDNNSDMVSLYSIRSE